MNKPQNHERVDDENPEWTDTMVIQAIRFDALPASLQGKLKSPPRGPQKKATKVATTIRISSDVMNAFKSTGKGWQTRINAALQQYLKEHPIKG